MKTERIFRAWRGARLPTVMLTLALAVGFASVGHAQDVTEMVVTAQKPQHAVTSALIRDEVQSDARSAARETRIEVAADLGLRLSKEFRPARVARAANKDNRG